MTWTRHTSGKPLHWSLAHQRTPAQLAQISRNLYRRGPLLLRKMQHYRPYICPFEILLAHLPEQGRILDIGCGSGLLLALASAVTPGIKGIGFDTSPAAIELARRLQNKDLEFRHLPAEAPWPAGQFDAVTAVDVLHHVPVRGQQEFILRAAAKVAPGGVFIYKDIAQRPMWRAAANRLHDLLIAREWIHYAPVEHVEKWSAAAELRLTHSEDVNRLWYPHQLRVFRRAS
jgi:cyclopropane fatty-acyl-phospholipid synthase-like methyltransferase